MKLCKRLKNQDQYGYVINLNFNQEGAYFKSKIGGLFSLAINGFILFLTIKRFEYMILKSQDQINIIQQDAELEKNDPLNFKDFNMLFYFKYKYFNPKEISDDINNEFDPSNFFDLIFLNVKSTQNDQRIENKLSPVKQCERKDFEKVQHGFLFDIYTNNNDFLLCQKDLSQILQNNLNPQYQDNQKIEIDLIQCFSRPECSELNEINKYASQMGLELHVIQEQIDFTKYQEKPTSFVDKYVTTVSLSSLYFQQFSYNIRINQINTVDYIFQFGQSDSYNFYDLDLQSLNLFVLNQPALTQQKQVYFQINFYLSDISIQYSRRIYGMFDIFGEVGGISSVFIALVQLLVGPISEFLFILKSIEKLFLLKTKDISLNKQVSKSLRFQNHQNKIKKYSNQLDIEQQNHLQDNRLIKFTLFETIYIFIFDIFGCENILSKKSKKLKMIFEKGKSQLDKEMDILKIIKDLRNIKIFKKLLGYKGLNKFVIQQSYKNIIEIDSSSESVNNDVNNSKSDEFQQDNSQININKNDQSSISDLNSNMKQSFQIQQNIQEESSSNSNNFKDNLENNQSFSFEKTSQKIELQEINQQEQKKIPAIVRKKNQKTKIQQN